MSVETWVGLLRNGACVIQDMDYLSFLKFSRKGYPGVTLVGSVIAPLQGAAVLFNLHGGVTTLSAGAMGYGVMGGWAPLVDSLSADESQAVALAKDQYAADRAASGSKVLASLCSFAISHGFVWLCLNTLKHPHEDLINCGLIGMEVALLVFLVYMAIGVAKRFSNARMAAAAARRLADGSDASEFFESADLPLFTVVASALGVSAPPTPWPAQAAEYLVSAYTKELAKYRSKALKETKTNIGKQRAAAALLSYEYSERMHGWLDLIVMLLNLAAFVGYAIFPVTYLVPQDTVSPGGPDNRSSLTTDLRLLQIIAPSVCIDHRLLQLL